MKKTIKRSVTLFLGIGLSYLIALIYPSFLFANTFDYQNFKVYSDRPIPEAMQSVLNDAICRLEYSELYNKKDQFKLFLCNDQWRFTFFTRNGNAGGVVNFLISPNIFIRECDIKNNRLIPPSSWKYQPNERPLSYFIAHEATHSLERKISTFLSLTSTPAILEGYADYIGKRPDFDYEVYKDLYIKRAAVMDPKNGQYPKYHLYMAYLMDREGLSFKEVLENKPDLELMMLEIEGK